MTDPINFPGLNKGGQHPQSQQIQIDPTSLPDIKCKCGCKYFMSAISLKKVSAIISPSGQEGYLPMQAMVCIKCQTELSEIEDDMPSPLE